LTPTIRIDEEVMAVLKENAEPFVDTPNSVLRRLLGLPAVNGSGPAEDTASDVLGTSPKRSRQQTRSRTGRRRRAELTRAQPGTILADEEYELPLLAILDSHGGRAPTREVLDELGERLRDRLMPADHERLGSGDIRWRNRAQFVRLRLIEQGDMASESPRGLWEITDQGRDRLVAE
jgi:Mrr N-terminal domain